MHAPVSPALAPTARQDRAQGIARVPALVAALRAHWPLLLAACAGIVTAFYRLGYKGLWGDEVWQVAWSQQQPLAETFQRFRAPPDLPLSFLLVQLSTTFTSDPFWVRLPSALLGAATVPLLYLLARPLFGRTVALAAAVLLAVAPYHVWYAQDARPYAALACYSLLTLLFFERLLQNPSPWNALGFTVATILNLYNHLFALFPLFVEVVVGLAWVALSWPRAQRSGGVARTRALRLAGSMIGGTIVALIVALPLFGGVAHYIVSGGPSDGGDVPIHLTGGTVVDLLALFGSGQGWPLALTVALCLVGVGTLAYRRDAFLGVALAWLILPLAVLWLAHPHHMFIPRYFLFMQPVYLLLVAYGLVSLVRGFVALVARPSVSRNGTGPGLKRPWQGADLKRSSTDRSGVDPSGSGPSHGLLRPGYRVLTAVAVALLAMVTVTPTWRGYAVAKVNDWSAICTYLHHSAGLGDVITGNSYTGGLMDWCFKGSTAVSLAPPGAYALPALAAGGRDVWYILVGAGSPDLPYIQRTYTAIPRAAWATPGLQPITTYDNRFTYPQAEFPATLYHYRATRLPSRFAFHDTHGASVNPTWPDFAQIGPGGRQIVRLSLPATRPRRLTLTLLNLVGRDLDVVVDNRTLLRLRPRETSLSWRTITVPLPSGLPDRVVVELRNPGAGVSAVSVVALVYVSGGA